MINLEQFIAKYVTKRPKSMFLDDLKNNQDALREKIEQKSVLVIGGAGSIGSSFVKALLPYRPKSLTVVDTNENALAELTRDLRSTLGMFVPQDYITYPIDYSSKVFRKMFRKAKGFDIVANFSAHKHVRSEKDIYSVEALVRNNVMNAKELLDLLTEFPPERYFCVSTDKAANPVNIMGASKRIMEDLIFLYSDKFEVNTARFANVAFSNGSLPAGFLERISKRQPISAPSDVKRYFVSPEESGQICLIACMLGKNREIFFPKLREEQMLSFDRIARDLLTESGFEIQECRSDEEAKEKMVTLDDGDKAYPVHFSKSDTSGEKMYEEFFTDSEKVDEERFLKLGVVIGKELTDKERIMQFMKDAETVFDNAMAGKEDVVSIMKKYLSEFKHIETGKSLDSKM